VRRDGLKNTPGHQAEEPHEETPQIRVKQTDHKNRGTTKPKHNKLEPQSASTPLGMRIVISTEKNPREILPQQPHRTTTFVAATIVA
jgi:hypothetical protein